MQRMDSIQRRTQLGSILVLALFSIFGLYLLELGHLIQEFSESARAEALSSLPPTEMIVGVVMVAMLPIFLLNSFWNKVTFWVSLVIATLMFVFHVLHVIEHGMMGDVFIAIWIFFTGVVTNGYAGLGIWQLRKE